MNRRKSLLLGSISSFLCITCVGLYVADADTRAERARTEALERYGGEQVEVLVARRDIASGESLNENIVEPRLWVADLLPEGALTSKAQAMGQPVRSGILKGEVICQARLGSATNQLEVPEGLTALSVPAKDVQAIGGAITPGMYVDIYATGAEGTARVLETVPVLATNVDKENSLASETIAWITVAVAPGKVSMLVEAAQTLTLYFTLPDHEIEIEEEE